MLPLLTRHREFERAIRAYSDELYAFAYWLCRDRQRARDLVQEACLRAWNAWESVRDQTAIKHWLFTILRNEHARTFERKRIEIVDVGLDTLELATDSGIEVALEVREALHALPESLRQPLLLQVLGGFSCAEIAATLDITEGAVMTRLTRARQMMRRLIEGSGQRKQRSLP